MTSAKGEQVLVNRDPAPNTDTDKLNVSYMFQKDANSNPIQGANARHRT